MNLPNLLSLMRLSMVPLVPVFYFSDLPYRHLWAAGVYGAASLTDVLDGIIARKCNMITRLGRVLDPLADKCMSFCVLICIIIGIDEPVLWWAAVVFFCKESLMGVGALVQYKKFDDVPPSNLIGKISTIFFFAVSFLLLIIPEFVPGLPRPAVITALSAAIALNLIAFCRYLTLFSASTKKACKTRKD
ncbi:MAG: CDP-alcohol phosphatidyltransferase family protein [Oscillospiraceae bacterium]|nr:CDP-alcohol phosphatidyltransferase family protein [Oscillospiraceae bacterium]